MNIENVKTVQLVPYAKNAKLHSKEQIKKIAESITEFGFVNPVLIDSDDGIIAGHGRVMAAKLLDRDTVPCIRLAHLTEVQKQAYILADNRLAEIGGGWDEDLLKAELEALQRMEFDTTMLGFDDMLGAKEEEAYTRKIQSPIYKPNGDRPEARDLCDTTKTERLLKAIAEAKGLSKEDKAFLIHAAHRHTVFNFEKVAEFYAHADAEVQALMEDSALVIIDFNKAVEQGFVQFNDDIRKSYMGDYADET